MKHYHLVFSLLLTIITGVSADAQNRYVHSKGGLMLGRKVDQVIACIKAQRHDTAGAKIIAICKCSVDMMNHNFSDEQVRRHVGSNGLNIVDLFSEDSTFEKRVLDCWYGQEQDKLLAFQQEYIAECKKTLQEATQKPLDPAKVDSFGSCQLQMVLSNEVPPMEIKKLDDPASAQFQKVVQKCGSPFKN